MLNLMKALLVLALQSTCANSQQCCVCECVYDDSLLCVHHLAPGPTSPWPVPLRSSSGGEERWPLAVQTPTPHPVHATQPFSAFIFTSF